MDSNPLTFDKAVKMRDGAMAQVEAAAEKASPGFGDAAANFIISYLCQNGEKSGETITDACKAAGIKPHDDRAFGPVYMRLSRLGKIVKTGLCHRRKGHGTAGANVWKLASPA